MAIICFILVGIGVGLIILGAVISVVEWNRKYRSAQRAAAREEEGVAIEGTGLPEALEGLAKLADALKDHPLGMRLIFAGIVVLVIAGIFGGVTQL
jgi:hypothetical protein